MMTAKQISRPIWRIEDPRGHAESALAGLRRLLADGAPMNPDPKRADFYEIAGESTVYWIHILPGHRTAVLLATWPANPAGAAEPVAPAQPVASVSAAPAGSAQPVAPARPQHAPYEPACIEA